MGKINFHTKEILIKIVFYGPELAGKSATIEHLLSAAPEGKSNQVVSLTAQNDHTVHFEFLPMAIAQLRGFDVRLQLYTVPGSSSCSATREIAAARC